MLANSKIDESGVETTVDEVYTLLKTRKFAGWMTGNSVMPNQQEYDNAAPIDDDIPF